MPKSPGQRRRGTGPSASQNTTSKHPGLVCRVGAEGFPVSGSTKCKARLGQVLGVEGEAGGLGG